MQVLRRSLEPIRKRTESTKRYAPSYLTNAEVLTMASAAARQCEIPHSNLEPPQRPERGLVGSDGTVVQGSQPILRYPSAYWGRSGIPFVWRSPDLFPSPICDEIHLPQGLACRQCMKFDLLQMLAARRLVATQSRKPKIKRFERSHERLNFAQLTTEGRIATVENA